VLFRSALVETKRRDLEDFFLSLVNSKQAE
jgi:hypothetical protein